MPKRWSNKKKKAMNGAWHQQLPDLKNILTAFEDGLLKQDKGIAFYSYLGKKWINSDGGKIEIKLPR